MRMHRHRDDDDLEGLTGLFRRASRLMARRHHRRDRAHHAQSHILDLLLERGAMNQGALLELLDVRSSSLSEVLRKLENRGLVARERDPEDKRRFVITTTEEAAAMHESSPNNEEAPVAGDALFACLTKEEQEQLRAILEKLIQSLADEDRAAKPGCGRGCRGGGRGRNGHGRGRGGPRGEGRGVGGQGRGRRRD